MIYGQFGCLHFLYKLEASHYPLGAIEQKTKWKYLTYYLGHCKVIVNRFSVTVPLKH